jgi:hypothetical protein
VGNEEAAAAFRRPERPNHTRHGTTRGRVPETRDEGSEGRQVGRYCTYCTVLVVLRRPACPSCQPKVDMSAPEACASEILRQGSGAWPRCATNEGGPAQTTDPGPKQHRGWRSRAVAHSGNLEGVCLSDCERLLRPCRNGGGRVVNGPWPGIDVVPARFDHIAVRTSTEDSRAHAAKTIRSVGLLLQAFSCGQRRREHWTAPSFRKIERLTYCFALVASGQGTGLARMGCGLGCSLKKKPSWSRSSSPGGRRWGLTRVGAV